jgi:antitoxin component HigA of HigAB toxin-antitoxin module
MDIKPIRTETDYQAALKEVERLIDSQLGTPEGDRMDVLVTLIEAYEARHFPIPEPDDPVGVLEYYMESRGLSRSDLLPSYRQIVGRWQTPWALRQAETLLPVSGWTQLCPTLLPQTCTNPRVRY